MLATGKLFAYGKKYIYLFMSTNIQSNYKYS